MILQKYLEDDGGGGVERGWGDKDEIIGNKDRNGTRMMKKKTIK